jgi:hypothetical protein
MTTRILALIVLFKRIEAISKNVRRVLLMIFKDQNDRRSGKDRRQLNATILAPDRRSGKDRRKNKGRRKRVKLQSLFYLFSKQQA